MKIIKNKLFDLRVHEKPRKMVIDHSGIVNQLYHTTHRSFNLIRIIQDYIFYEILH
jgi:hypothetical protein